MSLWRVWMSPDDGLAAVWTWHQTPDGRYEYIDVRVPYAAVETAYGARTFMEVDEPCVTP